MGKGFNNYMCKKFFHPASRDNLKRVWMAEQKTEAYKKKQEELRMQYEKEQDLYDNKAVISKESKDKLSVNFMYEPPPGTRKDAQQEPGGTEEIRFEWQRKYQAPRESYCKGDSAVRDQPFGIQVRNVRCIKCHKWGHINTDKECSMYSLSMSEAREIHSQNLVNESTGVRDNLSLEQQMFQDGLALKNSAIPLRGTEMIPENSNKSVLMPDRPEEEFIKALTTKQKKDLLKKLEKLEKKSSKSHKKKKDKKKKRKSRSSSSSSESSDSDNDRKHKKKENKLHLKEKDGKTNGRMDNDENMHHIRKHDRYNGKGEKHVEKRDEKRDRKDRKRRSSEDDRSTDRDHSYKRRR